MLALPFSIGFLPEGTLRVAAAAVLGVLGVSIVVANWAAVWQSHREGRFISPIPFIGALFLCPIAAMGCKWAGLPLWAGLGAVLLADPGAGAGLGLSLVHWIWRRIRRSPGPSAR
ncbi:MAG: hypothetical protein GC172_12795 [Phycisphaera sp.]|nr:hypothetical protein [Phycisphaera sp.]